MSLTFVITVVALGQLAVRRLRVLFQVAVLTVQQVAQPLIALPRKIQAVVIQQAKVKSLVRQVLHQLALQAARVQATAVLAIRILLLLSALQSPRLKHSSN